MSKIEKAVSFMEKIAKDDRHGYDQIYRWGEKGDYDCSALVITAFEKAGFPVKKYGASYTGNMKNAFLKAGFKDVINKVNVRTGAGLKRGDILLNTTHHTAVYCGNNKIVQASINEKGRATGGKAGDQTGREINISPYRNYRFGWDVVLRYQETKNTKGSDEVIRKIEIETQNKIETINSINVDSREYGSLRDLATLGIIKLNYDAKNKRPIIEKAN